jgi:hypothetical protein
VANPNIVNVTSILGNTSSNLISSTDDPFATALVANAASSGKVYKINSIVVANVDGSAAADITIKYFLMTTSPEQELQLFQRSRCLRTRRLW